MRSLRIEAMRRRHVPRMLRIERRVYSKPWSFALYTGELALPEDRRYYRVALLGGRLVGYGGLMFVSDEAHVTTLAVHPDCQGQRIGSRLLLVLAREAVERGATGLTLEVRMSNAAARALYGRFGFAPAGVRKNYYPEVGEDALIMWLHDIDQPGFAERLDEIEADLPPAAVRGQRSGPDVESEQGRRT